MCRPYAEEKGHFNQSRLLKLSFQKLIKHSVIIIAYDNYSYAKYNCQNLTVLHSHDVNISALTTY